MYRRTRELAETMVGLGTAHGVRTVAMLTDMSTPLGLTAGNALEVRESLEVLAGGGPSDVETFTRVQQHDFEPARLRRRNAKRICGAPCVQPQYGAGRGRCAQRPQGCSYVPARMVVGGK